MYACMYDPFLENLNNFLLLLSCFQEQNFIELINISLFLNKEIQKGTPSNYMYS